LVYGGIFLAARRLEGERVFGGSGTKGIELVNEDDTGGGFFSFGE
jgi:hypothetical protein